MFKHFVFSCLVEVKANDSPLLVKIKEQFIHPAVSDGATDVTVRRRDMAVTVIEAMSEIFSSADVKNVITEYP
mgnify:CR=1 FL=1